MNIHLPKPFQPKQYNIPVQGKDGIYRWPNGELFYTQGDCQTCSTCTYVSPTGSGRCTACRRNLLVNRVQSR